MSDKQLMKLEGVITIHVPIKLIVTKAELDAYDNDDVNVKNMIMCMAKEQCINNIDISDEDEPYFESANKISKKNCKKLIENECYQPSLNAMVIIDNERN